MCYGFFNPEVNHVAFWEMLIEQANVGRPALAMLIEQAGVGRPALAMLIEKAGVRQVLVMSSSKFGWQSAGTSDVNRASGRREILAMPTSKFGGRAGGTRDVNRSSLVGDRSALAILIEQAGVGRPTLAMLIVEATGTCDVNRASGRSANTCNVIEQVL